MLVMKFGGTSVGDATCLRRVAGIIAATYSTYSSPPPVVVVSAIAGVTDALIDLAQRALKHEADFPADLYIALAQLSKQHLSTLDKALGEAPDRAGILQKAAPAIRSILGGVRNACLQIHEDGAVVPARFEELRDRIAACGEKLSSTLLAAILAGDGYKAEAVFSDSGHLITDDTFGAAQPLVAEAYPRLRARLLPLLESQTIPIVTGYIGSTIDGRTTTLGRGGSDYSASLVGAALNCSQIWIWTDVDGIMTADPKVVSSARPLETISYREAAQLSRFGAKVIHPRTVLPAVECHIPIIIKNTFNTSFPGTVITTHFPVEDDSITIKGITSITSRHLHHDLDDASWQPDPVIEGHIGNNGYRAPDDSSVVTAVGNGLPARAETLEQLRQALSERKITLLSLKCDPSERNLALCFIVPEEQEQVTVRTLHEILFA